MPEDKSSKTEQPTPRRMSESRQKGQVAKSQEVNTFAILLSAVLVLFMTGAGMYNRLADVMVRVLSRAGQISLEGPDLMTFLTGNLVTMALVLGPLFLVLYCAAILANLIQVGPLFTTQTLQPNLNKLNPITGLGKLFSKRSLVEMFKSIGKITLIASIAFFTIRGEMDQIIHLGDMSPAQIGYFAVALAFEIFLKTCWALAFLAILDFAFQKWQHMEDMKMTKEEIKEEHRQTEGDPLVKSRIRSLQRDAARRRMMSKVPDADVVVTNPTHLAVALYYDPEQADAPVVVAKGRSLLAERIKKIAREHGVPVVEDKPLARALYKSVEVGQVIPIFFYKAVAEILSYVYRLKGKNVNGGR